MAPKESREQETLMEWAAWCSGKHPELKMLFHIPNGGSRNLIEAAHMKAQGVKAGVPDLMLPVARGGFHGLFIELKRQKGGRVSEAQEEWIRVLNREGYLTVVCAGWGEASRMIEKYLEEEETE